MDRLTAWAAELEHLAGQLTTSRVTYTQQRLREIATTMRQQPSADEQFEAAFADGRAAK